MIGHGVASVAGIIGHRKCVVAGFGSDDKSVIVSRVDYAV